MVSKEIVKKVTSQIAKKYPELSGVEPVVEERIAAPAEAVISALSRVDRKLVATLQKSRTVTKQKQVKMYVARFEKVVVTQRGDRIRKIVKVSFDRNGEILKTVVSK
ncbi:MAG: hypothetical protein QME66_11920 [Candidatus Eisenbacteria bacterium]|nr:hypothetical protein [Candidatus Eisenbacteria bacterium]